jgi:hypothetical protein
VHASEEIVERVSPKNDLLSNLGEVSRSMGLAIPTELAGSGMDGTGFIAILPWPSARMPGSNRSGYRAAAA